jgi:hypothetical protein
MRLQLDNSEFPQAFQVCAISMTKVDKPRQAIVPVKQASASKPATAAPHPLDGSQFHAVIDEQVWSELRPTQEEQRPRRAHQLPAPAALSPHPDDPAISVGEI